MAAFTSDGVEIAYFIQHPDSGAGKPVILVHGFGSNHAVNWVHTGWVDVLKGAGHTVVMLDNRGHGQSEKLYDPEAYPARFMARDVINLMDHLDILHAAVIGYSMGARISALAALEASQRVDAVVFGGLGINMVRGMRNSEEIVAALEAPTLADVTHPVGRQYRIFADHTKSDRKALAACMKSGRERISEDDISRISMPALVAVGSDDDVAGAPGPLAELMPGGESLVIPKRDHMRATGDKAFKEGVLEFLGRVY